jgi:hypothetical protein
VRRKISWAQSFQDGTERLVVDAHGRLQGLGARIPSCRYGHSLLCGCPLIEQQVRQAENVEHAADAGRGVLDA